MNRVVRRTDEGPTYEADSRQAGELIQELSLNGDKPVVTPCVKATQGQVAGAQGQPLPRSGGPGKLLGIRRSDIQFSAKGICRWMQEPAELGVMALKRLTR